MTRARTAAVVALCALGAQACSVVLGLEDAEYDPASCAAEDGLGCAGNDDAGALDAAASDASDAAEAMDAADDAPTDAPVSGARCGDGVLDPGEACDDGNDVPGDGCTSCRIDCAPPAFEEAATHRCFWVDADGASWSDALLACVDQGGQLASLDAPEEIALVLEHVAAPTWTGGNDLATPGAFTWAGGGAIASDLWAPGEPDHPQSSRCVALAPTSAGLATEPCAQKLPAVCERVPPP